MTDTMSNVMYTAGKLAEELGISQGKVRKLIENHGIAPDEIKRNCKYYSSATLESLKKEVEEV